MRKVILFLSIVVSSFMVTSCLDGNRNYSEPSVVYIATEGFTTYGRTLSGRFISSPQIKMMMPGSLHLMNYSWDEEYGSTPVGDYLADNVVVAEGHKELTRISLFTGTPPEVENRAKFTHDLQPLGLGMEQFIGDYWVFEYGYKAREGETSNVRFYLDLDASDIEKNEAVIYVHIEIVGEPKDETKSPTQAVDYVALDMSQLRSMYEGSSETSAKAVKVQLKYYRENSTDEVKRDYQFLVAGN